MGCAELPWLHRGVWAVLNCPGFTMVCGRLGCAECQWLHHGGQMWEFQLPTDHHLLPFYWTLPSALPSVRPWPVTHTVLPLRNRPHTTSCSLVLCTKKQGTSFGRRKLRYRRSCEVPRNSLKKQISSFSPQA